MANPVDQAVGISSTSQPEEIDEKSANPASNDENFCKEEADFLNDVCAATETQKRATYTITAGMTAQIQKITAWFQIRNSNDSPSSEDQHQNPYSATDREIDEDVIPQDFIDHGSAPSRGDNSTYHGGAKDSLWNTNRKIPDGLIGRKSGGWDDDKDKKGDRDGGWGSGGGGDDGDKGWISGVMSAGVKVDLSTSPMPEIARPLPVMKQRQGILKSVWNSGVVLEKLRSEAVYAVESVILDIFPGLGGPTQAVSDSDQKRRHKVIDYRLRMQGRLAHRDYEQMRQMKARFEEKQQQRQLQIEELVKRGEYVGRSVDDSLLPEEVRPIRLRRTWKSVTMWKDQRRRRWVIHVPVNISWDDLGYGSY